MATINFQNLTPHAVTFVLPDGGTKTIAPSGKLARVACSTVSCGEIGGVPITRTEYGKVQDLPDPEPDTVYIVSSLVAQRVPDRDDVFIPNESVRDEQGRIIGCKSLGRV